MAFEYYGGVPQRRTENPYATQEPQQQQAMPLQGLGGFGGMGGMPGMGGAETGAGGLVGGGSAGSASTAGAGGTQAAGSASSGGGGFASAGPWALLAAVIIGNEYNARKGGYRSEDDKQYAKDVFGGKVVEQDVNQRWVPKAFGKDKYGFGGDTEIWGELSTLDFSNAWDKFKNKGTFSKLINKIF